MSLASAMWIDAGNYARDRQHKASYDQLLENYDDLVNKYGAEVALSACIQFQLRGILGKDADVPLLNDVALRDRIRAAGAYAMTKWNTPEADHAGKAFKLEPHQLLSHKETGVVASALFYKLAEQRDHNFNVAEEAKGLLTKSMGDIAQYKQEKQATDAKLVTMQARLRELEAGYAKSQKELGTMVKNCAHHMAQAAAFRQQLEIAEPDNPLVTSPELRERLAHVAFAQLEADQYKDWGVVRQIGRSFVSDEMRERAIGKPNQMLAKSREKVRTLEAEKIELDQENEMLAKRMEEICQNAAHHIALAAAFRQQLEIVEPKNPLIVDNGLRVRLKRKSVEKLVASLYTDWTGIEEIGRTFITDEVRQQWLQDGGVDKTGASTISNEVQAQDDQKAVDEGIAALQLNLDHALEHIAHYLSQAAAFRQQLEIVEPNNPLLVDKDLRVRLARLAYEHLRSSGFTDWDGVRNLGRSYVSDAMRQQALDAVKTANP